MDIFGNAIAVDTISKKGSETIKSRFRKAYGFDDEHFCKDCRHCIFKERDRRYYKCELMGTSASEATDIRLKDPACSRWEKNEHGTEGG